MVKQTSTVKGKRIMKNTIMSLKQIGEELFDPTMQTACLKSSNPEVRLRYLEIALNYHTAESLPGLLDNLARDVQNAILGKP